MKLFLLCFLAFCVPRGTHSARLSKGSRSTSGKHTVHLAHEEYAPAEMDFMHQFLADEGINVGKAVKSAAVLAAEARRDELMKGILEGSETKSATTAARRRQRLPPRPHFLVTSAALFI